MRATFQLLWVRKLTGQTRVPYNRGLQVRGSPHPQDYGDVLPPRAAESNAFRMQSDLLSGEASIAAFILFHGFHPAITGPVSAFPSIQPQLSVI
jgi:hypothetical protein